jgi:hypothetical protein
MNSLMSTSSFLCSFDSLQTEGIRMHQAGGISNMKLSGVLPLAMGAMRATGLHMNQQTSLLLPPFQVAGCAAPVVRHCQPALPRSQVLQQADSLHH